MGGSASFRELYDEHFAFVWRSMRRLGVREGDVADCVQEVFVVVHRKLGEFEGRSKMTSWLFGICVRVASDHRRSAVVRREIATDDEALSSRADPRSDVGADVERRQKEALLERILDDMPDEQRIVFALFELDGMPGEAIAELLDVPIGTVRSRLRLARENFQRAVARAASRDTFHVRGQA